MQRRAASPEFFDALAQHFRSDGLDSESSGHLASEVMAHGKDFGTDIDQIERDRMRFLAQGYSQEAARHMSIEAQEEDY